MNFLLNTYFAYLVRTVVIFIVVVPGEPLRHLVCLRQGAVAALLLPQLTHPARRCRSVFPLKRLLQEAVGGYGAEHGRPSRRPPPRGGGRVRIGRLRDDGDHFETEFTYNFLLSNVEISEFSVCCVPSEQGSHNFFGTGSSRKRSGYIGFLMLS